MPLRILLADDSMTAQNMGKKILSDAGYEVTAVSNGAAALKKSTELKPDLVVLDIYMPGYTGLEVCERLKNAPDTAHIPVLLTVGKLEPYRAEDGARVRAEGVIIKPFEATDLLAAVNKIASSAVEPVPQTEPEIPKPVAPFAVTPAPIEVLPATQFPVSTGFDAPQEPNPLDLSLPNFGSTAVSSAAMPAFNIDPLHDFSTSVATDASASEPLNLNTTEVLPLDESSTPHAAAAINLDFLRAPVEAPAPPTETIPSAVIDDHEETSAAEVELTHFELEQAIDPTHQLYNETIEIDADPALVTDPADLTTFAVKVGAVSPALETVQHDPLEVVLSEQEPESVTLPDAADALLSLGKESPVPAVAAPEDASGLAVVELFHEEYDPAPDGGIDLSVPAYQTATPPSAPIYANAGMEGFAVTPAMQDYLDRQAQASLDSISVATPEVSAATTAELELGPEIISVEPVLGEESVLKLPADLAVPDEIPAVVAQLPAVEDDSPLDIDALLSGIPAAEVEPVPSAAAAEPEEVAIPESAEPEPEPLFPEVSLPEPIQAEPEPVAQEVIEPATEEPVAAELADSSVDPVELPTLSPEPEPAPAPLEAHEVAVAPAAEAIEAALQQEVIDDAAPLAQAQEAQPEPAPVLATISEAETEKHTEPSDGLSAVDRAQIAGVIQRVFDRYKPQIIADITRELMK